jgi:hypothetical protein
VRAFALLTSLLSSSALGELLDGKAGAPVSRCPTGLPQMEKSNPAHATEGFRAGLQAAIAPTAENGPAFYQIQLGL